MALTSFGRQHDSLVRPPSGRSILAAFLLVLCPPDMGLSPQSATASSSPPPRLTKPSARDSGPGCSHQSPSPELVNPHYKQPCFSRPLIASCFMGERLGTDPSPVSTGAMAGPGWRCTDSVSAALAPTSSQYSASGMLTADYDPPAEFEAGLSPVPYPYGGGYPPGCSTQHASGHLVQNAPRSAGSRDLPGGFARQMKQRDGLNVGPAGPSFGAAAYPIVGALQASYDASLSPFAISPRPYDAAPSTSTWRTQNCGKHALEESSQSELPSPPPSMASSAGLSRTRRIPRKHTTKEEANFQCGVQGCGKFFSRSYNFKSHMETHDEQREYPFPCLVGGCAKKFVRKTDLQRHHQSVHRKERNHRCDYCGRLFARKDTLRR